MDTSDATVKLIGAALSGDRAAGEKAERDLDVLIAKRDKARRSDEAERAREELWQESVRRHNAARDAQLREEWRRVPLRPGRAPQSQPRSAGGISRRAGEEVLTERSCVAWRS